MKKLLAIAIFSFIAFTHTAKAQEKCLSEIMFQMDAKANPQLLQNRENLDKWIRKYSDLKKAGAYKKVSSGPATFIIPTVVHVIHYGGPENISKAQIDDQMRILNEDYRRLNPDTTSTPIPFQSLGADVGVEFRLAQIDPNGNCTNGVTRHYSALTFNSRNNIKAFDYWPNDKYFNVWVVGSIANTNGTPGDVIGFAQFPGSGSDTTDGVVIRSSYFGSIGTAANNGENGRTLTHEAGHWLSLRHIWGDATGCGTDDGIGDTPLQDDKTFSICPPFPLLDACQALSPGVLFSDYMDYTNGNCMNIFTIDQADAMAATLNASASHRNSLWTPANLIATGTDGTPPVLCEPVADFTPRPKYLCAGGNTQFFDASWGGLTGSRVWTFQGGTPATDTSANPTITYANPGVYDVSLTVTNTAGNNTKTITGLVNVLPTSAPSLIPLAEGFESGTFPFSDWYLLNSNGLATWTITSAAAKTGTKSLYIKNYGSANDKGPDEFILPAMNLSNVTGTTMTFDLAFAYLSTTTSNADKLSVYYSVDCGKSWTSRKTIQGTSFPTTTGAVTFNFTPVSTQWRTETVNFSALSISSQPNVRFRFEFTHDSGNNIYLDNININGNVTGIDEVNADNSNVTIYPNPSSSSTYVDFTTVTSGNVKIEVMDASGRLIETFKSDMPAGDHQYQMNNDLEKGVYLVRLSFGQNAVTKKVVIE